MGHRVRAEGHPGRCISSTSSQASGVISSSGVSPESGHARDHSRRALEEPEREEERGGDPARAGVGKAYSKLSTNPSSNVEATRGRSAAGDANVLERDQVAIVLQPVEMPLELRRRRRRVRRRRMDRVVAQDDGSSSRIGVRERHASGRVDRRRYAFMRSSPPRVPDGPAIHAGSHISNRVPPAKESTASAAARFDRQK